MNSIKKLILLLFILCATSIWGAQSKSQEQSDNLTDAEKAYVLSKFCTEVKYNYVFYNDLTFDWDSLCHATLPILLETKTFDGYVKEMRRLCAKLEDGHTYIYEGNDSPRENWIKPLPMETKRFGNQLFASRVLSSELREKGIERGIEILEINDMTAIDFADTHIKPYVAASTPQWRDHIAYNSYELTKDRASIPIKMKIKNSQGKTSTIETSRNVGWDNGSNPTFVFKVLEGNIGYLKITTFQGNTFRDEFDKIYEEIKKTEGLIIDIRSNSGGNSLYADYIISHLSDTPIKRARWSSRMYIAAHGSWGYPQEWLMETPNSMQPVSNKERYTKPVSLLINEGTFSSSENFCVLFRGMNRGKLIGTATGGSTGNPIRINLGHNIYTTICTRNEWDIDDNKFIGIGILPDIEVRETKESFLENRDNVLEKALSEMK